MMVSTGGWDCAPAVEPISSNPNQAFRIATSRRVVWGHMAERLTLQVIIASTRPERKGPLIAAWFLKQVTTHAGFASELIDLAQVNLPMFDEPRHPRFRQYEHEHTKAWSAVIDRADCFVFVTPE